MKALINVKGVSNKRNRVKQIEFTYPDSWLSEGSISVKELLIETVRIMVKEYNEQVEKRSESKDSLELMQIFSNETIMEKAATGKIDFGVIYNEKKQDEEKAAENALQCFVDGMVALFVGEDRYESLDEVICVKEGMELTFIRLTFLAGRMW